MELALITAAPFALALLLAAPFTRAQLKKPQQTWLSALLMAALFVWLASMFPRVEADGALVQRLDWMPALGISLSFYLDGLSLLFGLIISGVGALIFFFAGYYFDDSAEHNRFMIWLAGFAGAMLALVLSGNLLMLFIAWELTSVTSFLLIGFNGAKDEASRYGAFKALFVTSGGALALIIGLVMLAVAAGQIAAPDAGSHIVAELDAILNIATLHEHDWFPLFATLILLGCFTKSAQFPFHFWLPGAMSAPTPASAYLHSATMVKAGIYLVARLSPIMHQNELWTGALMSAGLLTMLVGSYFALRQDDLKGLLAYATVSKLGAIMALLGLPGQYGMKAALVGIIAHALYKSALFMVAGTIDHAAHTRRIGRLGGLRTELPVLFWVTVVSALSMAGMPLLMGFVAKETLLDAMLHHTGSWSGLVMTITLVSAALTALAAYMLIGEVFLGRRRRELQIHLPPRPIFAGPALLAVGSLCMGFLLEPLVIPLLRLAVPKKFELPLFAGFNEVFWLSAGVLAAGAGLYMIRKPLIRRIHFPISGDAAYHWLIDFIDHVGSDVLHLQSGYVRYYLVWILGAVSVLLLVSGALSTVTEGQRLLPDDCRSP